MEKINARLLDPLHLVLEKPLYSIPDSIVVKIGSSGYDSSIIEIDEEIMGGTPVISGTRIPVYFIFEYLKNGSTISRIIEQFSSLSKEKIKAVIEQVNYLLGRTEDEDICR